MPSLREALVIILATFMTMVLINSHRLMKHLFKMLVPMTAVVIAFISCNREQEKISPDETKHLQITVKASPDEIESTEPETKTYINASNQILWGTGEYMKIGVFDGTATAWGNSADATADAWDGDEQAYFNFSITPVNASGAYTYYGVYPANVAVAASNEDPAAFKVDLPATQNATASSYDPKAYILVARPESGKTDANADWTAYFRRATALNRITLSNLTEDIKRVTITAANGTKLVGRRYFDLTEGTSGEVYSGGNSVTIRYASKLDHSSPMDIWFTSWGVDIAEGSTLTIVAISDAHTYTRTLTARAEGIHFKEGYLNTLSVNMSTAVEGDNTELAEGKYVILAKNNTTYYALKNEASGTRMASVNYTGSTSEYVYDNANDLLVWTVTDEGDGTYSIMNANKYLGWASGNEAACNAKSGEWAATNYAMVITWDGTNSCYHVAVNNDNNRILARNNSNAYFAYYTGSQYKDLLFVPATYDDRTAVSLHFEDDGDNVVTSANYYTFDYESFIGYNLIASPDVDAVKNNINWSVSGDTNGIISDFLEGLVELSGNAGTATITASFDGDENYRAAEASYTITVTAPYTASEAYAAATTTSVPNVTVKGIVSAITTAFDTDKVTYTLSDNGLTSGNQFTVYRGAATSADDVLVGDCVIVKGSLLKYNTTPEFTQGAVIQKRLRAPSFTGTENFETNTSVTLASNDGATIYYTVDGSEPTTSSSVYSSALNISATTTVKAFAVKDGLTTGVVSKTYTKVSAYAVTFATPSHGTITVKHGETVLSSGDTVPEGETITVVTTPASGYELATLVYNDGEDHDIKTTKTFTMPAHAVNITATFQEKTSYTITFKTGNGDGSSASTSTACSTIVSDGSSYLSGNLVTATNVYYNGGSGLKLGTSSGAGVLKMNLAANVTPTSVVVRAKRYNSTKAATIAVNGKTAQSVTADFANYTFNITEKITYLQLNSSKYLWVESVTVNY